MSWSKGDHLVPTGTPTTQQMSFNSGHAQVKKSFSLSFTVKQKKTDFFLEIKIKIKINFFVAFLGSNIQ